MISTVMLIRVARNCAFMRTQEPNWPRVLCVQDVSRSVIGRAGIIRSWKNRSIRMMDGAGVLSRFEGPSFGVVIVGEIEIREFPRLFFSSRAARNRHSHNDSAEILMEYRESAVGCILCPIKGRTLSSCISPPLPPPGNQSHRRFVATSRSLYRRDILNNVFVTTFLFICAKASIFLRLTIYSGDSGGDRLYRSIISHYTQYELHTNVFFFSSRYSRRARCAMNWFTRLRSRLQR